MSPSSENLPYPLIRGGQQLAISKVPDEFTIRSRAGADERALSRGLGCVVKERLDGQELSVLSVDAAARDEAMGHMRGLEEVAFASHAYTLSNDPLGRVYLTDEITLQFHPGTAASAKERLAAEHGLRFVKAIPGLDDGHVFQLTAAARSNPLRLAHQLSRLPEVAYCEANVAIRSLYYYEPSDTLFKHQWYLHHNGGAHLEKDSHIDITRAWDITRGARSIIIAVVDDYIDTSHRDLAGPGKIVAPRDLTGHDDDPALHSHGTACAGIAVAEENGWGIVGAAPACALMPIRLAGMIDDNIIENLFGWAAGHGAAVISNSWGVAAANFPLSVRQHIAIHKAATEGRGGKGCVICFAAGNVNRPLNGAVDERGWPGNRLAEATRWYNGFAAHPDVIAVSACTSLNKKAAYSNWGPEVSVCAPSNNGHPSLGEEPSYPKISSPFPGKSIYTTDRVGRAGYGHSDYTSAFGGTSSACPLVAGVAALMLSVNPALTAAEVKQILETTADKIEDHSRDPQLGLALGTYDGKGHSQWFGYGKVNAYRAVVKAGGREAIRPGSFTGHSAPALAISDNQYEGVAVPIQVAEKGVVKGLEVSVHILHSYIGDLKVSLVSPSGKKALLHDKQGGGKNKIRKTYTTRNAPALTGLLGELTEGAWWLAIQDIAPRDRGKLEEWSLSLVFNPTRLIILESHPGAAIPDDQPFGTEWALKVGDQSVVKKITLGVDITHPFIADLQLALTAPSGAKAMVHNRKGGASDDIKRVYSSCDTPALQPLLGQPAKGEWRLCVKDLAFGGAGKLNSWSLQLEVEG